MRGKECDLLLLDLGLPGMDGMDVLETLRAEGRTLPVIIITARDALPDRVGGLNAGADDYLVKPFHEAELLARIRAVWRRRAVWGVMAASLAAALLVTAAGWGIFLMHELREDDGLRTAARNATWSLLPLLPLLLLLPLFGAAVGTVLIRAFRPLSRVAETLEMRRPENLDPLPLKEIPAEMVPFVSSINHLLGRVETSMHAQQRFVADAAHALRTPLAALLLQAERLNDLDLPPEVKERAAVLQMGIEREQRLVAQNLIENAIRYSRVRGRVDVSILNDETGCALVVEDDGPGIAPEDREKVMLPFRRLDGAGAGGSGLGLAIVQSIAGRLGATVRLDGRSDGRSGLCVRVEFPKYSDHIFFKDCS